MSRAGMTRALVALFAADAALALALAWVATRPRDVVFMPSAKALRPGDPDEASLRQFAVYFAVNLETYTSATFPAQERLVRRLAAAEAEPLLAERRRAASDAGLESSLFIDPDSIRIRRVEGGFETVLQGLKRHTLGGRLSWEAPFEYAVGVEISPPTEGNPYGLCVRRFAAKRLDDAKTH